jgi:hypothetical protein
MGFFMPWLYARVALLLAMVILLCFGTFLSLFPIGHEGSTALTKARSSHVNQTTNVESRPLDGSYRGVPAEEAEKVDKHPVNADLLTALLLLAVSFGAIVLWSLANGWWHRAFRFVGLRWPFVTTLEDRPFLGVFRL